MLRCSCLHSHVLTAVGRGGERKDERGRGGGKERKEGEGMREGGRRE